MSNSSASNSGSSSSRALVCCSPYSRTLSAKPVVSKFSIIPFSCNFFMPQTAHVTQLSPGFSSLLGAWTWESSSSSLSTETVAGSVPTLIRANMTRCLNGLIVLFSYWNNLIFSSWLITWNRVVVFSDFRAPSGVT